MQRMAREAVVARDSIQGNMIRIVVADRNAIVPGIMALVNLDDI